ncbi:hypothetical protein EDC04DRAFT_2962726 [Pisolithus marmoratus]|nr:hypothetical protein EDC04DRAFT_2962726 [Pisolithus marmoratus]
MTGDTSSLPQTLMTDATWDLQQSPYSANSMDTADWGYYTIPLSPPTSLSSNTSESPEPSSKKLRLSVSPDRQLEGEHQRTSLIAIFGFTTAVKCQPAPRKEILRHHQSRSKKDPRHRGENQYQRFVPPDPLPQQAAEAGEFEAMEVRVRQLEDENARLQQLAQKGNQYEELRSEIEHLQAQLQAAEKRELNLSMEIAGHSASLAVKAEMGVDVYLLLRIPQNHKVLR